MVLAAGESAFWQARHRAFAVSLRGLGKRAHHLSTAVRVDIHMRRCMNSLLATSAMNSAQAALLDLLLPRPGVAR